MTFIKNLAFVFMALLVPGAGLLLTGLTWFGLSIPFAGLSWTFIFSYTRFIVTANGFLIFLLGIFFIHLSTFVWGLTRHLNPNHHYSRRSARVFISAAFLIAINLGITVLSHLHKEKIYGFAFFHIPSVSMAPVLLPGDVIMVDTWSPRTKGVGVADVLVFKADDKGLTFVKRVAEIRGNENRQELFMRGDNPSRSTDSRAFGWIPKQNVIGKATFIWFSFRYDRYFKTTSRFNTTNPGLTRLAEFFYNHI